MAFKPPGWAEEQPHDRNGEPLPSEARKAFEDLGTEGKELRDRFAICALQGMLSSECVPDYTVMGAEYISYETESAAKRAYAMADAMLKARIPA